MGLERLANSVDIHLLGRAGCLRADRPTRSPRRRGARARGCRSRRRDRSLRRACEVIIASASPQLTPVAPGMRCKRDEIAGVLALLEDVARVVVVDHPDRDLDPRARASGRRSTGSRRSARTTPASRSPPRRSPALRRARSGRRRSSLRSLRRARSSATGTRASVRGPGGCRSPARHGRADIAALAAPERARRRRTGSGARPRCGARRVRRARDSLGLRTTGRSRSSGGAATGLNRARHNAAARPPRAAHCGTARARTSASRRPCPRRSRQARRTGTRAAAVIGSMSAPVSITAPWPAKMFLPDIAARRARASLRRRG